MAKYLQAGHSFLEVNSNNISLILYGIYSIVLLIKLTRNEIAWRSWMLVELLMLFFGSGTLFMFEYVLVGCSVCIFGLILHWSSLPQKQIPAHNKAVLVTGKARAGARGRFESNLPELPHSYLSCVQIEVFHIEYIYIEVTWLSQLIQVPNSL